MTRPFPQFFWAFFPFLFILGCHPRTPTPVLPPSVETLVVLPFDSESNDIDAPDILQRLVYLALEPSGYTVFDYKETNEKLKEMGFQEGGQLAAIDPTKLGQELGVQGLMFGNVESFGYLNIGVYTSRKVVLELWLVDVTTGETIWEGLGKGITRTIALEEEEIKKNLAVGLADQVLDKLFKTPLQFESEIATRRALYSLPGFQFRGFAHDDQTKEGQRAVKDAMKDALREK